MHVLGTAGHVDHGKTTLVRALTGMDTDRLREEKERQLTIDLGFAWMTLPGGEDVGIVDVPGHRDFIENMLAGVGGIDAALLVVAADEGVMPQTREHLAILDLLEIKRGLVALTKIDMIHEPDWLELVEEEVRSELKGTSLAEVPILRVSGKTEEGVAEMGQALADLLTATPSRANLGRPRLPIDRAFSVAGFGTVVTGTLLDGTLTLGQDIEVQPGQLEGRIRGLQTHKEEVEMARPGSRVAVNISGIDVDSLARGQVLGLHGQDRPTTLVDASFRLLSSSPTTVAHNQEVKVFLGAAQRMGRVRLLQQDELHPGESGWLQLLLPEPIVARRGDRYILRRPSPPVTIGGGQVADEHPGRKHPLQAASVVNELEGLLGANPERVLLEVLRREAPTSTERLMARARLPEGEAGSALRSLLEEGAALQLAGGTAGELLIDSEAWERLTARAEKVVQDYHRQFPLRQGIPQEELRSRLGASAGTFPAFVQRWTQQGVIRVVGEDRLAHDDFTPEVTAAQAKQVAEIEERLLADPYGPPSVKETRAALGAELYHHLLARGTLVQVSEDVVFHEEAYARMVAALRERLSGDGTIEVAEVRDLFETSRKYALALMEHLDDVGVTVREGDVRRLS